MQAHSPICLWSGPRNVSTALMYSFRERDDIRVVDEPLYGHYLHVSGANHPGGADVMAAMNCNGDAVMLELIESQSAATDRRLFMKHMAHHLVDIDRSFLKQTTNVLLIRNPREMLPSLSIQVPQAELADTGLKTQWELYEQLVALGQEPAVLDSRELLLDPPSVLSQLCEYLDIPFDTTMLSWNPGPRAEDGVWAPHWYHAVHKSTGFAPYKPKKGFPDALLDLLEACAPWYERLYAYALRADRSNGT